MRKLGLARGESRLSPKITLGSVTWEKLVARLTDVKRTEETYEQYLAFPPDKRAAIKDVGFFVGGRFARERRRRDELLMRSLLSFDIDHLDPFEDPIERVLEVYPKRELMLTTTHSHGPETPRLRLVMPLSEDIPPDQYEPIARMVASELGLDYFDDTTFQCSRIMYWPSAASDGEFLVHHQAGEWVDPKAVLALYDDPMDFGTWPHSTRIQALVAPTTHARDPLEAPGVIGAFNRCFDIHSVIHRFELPYETTAWDNRYHPVGSTGAAGAIVYDGVFMYSWHESDPAGLKNLNAFDLVRIHQFGDYTATEIRDEVATTRRESVKQMLATAMQMTEVREEIARGEMPDLDAEELLTQARAADEGERIKKQTSRLTFDELREEIEAINPSKAKLDALVIRIAAAKLDPVDTDVLAAVLRDHWTDPPPKKDSILKQIETQARRLTADLATDGTLGDRERELIEATLEEHYGGGRLVKRIGRRFWTDEHGLWALADDEAVGGKLVKTLTRLREERPEELMELVATVGDSKTSALTGSLWALMCRMLAERETRDDPLQLKRHMPLPAINHLGGELWFDAGGGIDELAHVPEHFWTTQIATLYDPLAECPIWDDFAQMIFSEGTDGEDMVRHLEELIGYIIGNSRWLKTWVLFHGATDTGKTTVCDVLAELLGPAFLAAPLSRFGSGYAFTDSSLIGKLALVDDDFSQGDSLPDGFMKKISEEKVMTVEVKWGDAIQFLCRAIPIVCSNHWPVTRDVSDAFRERALVFGFTHRIEGAEKDDLRKARMLRDEMPGILNKGILGLARLRARGHWLLPIDAAIAHEIWVQGSNAVMVFIDEVMEKDPGGFVHRSKVWSGYRNWQRYVGGEMMKQRTLFERLDQVLGPHSKNQGHIGWQNWQIGPTTTGFDDLDA